MYGITEVNRENYKNIKWVAAGLSIEYQYQYRGLNFFCDRVHDFGIYIDNYWVYLELPTGPKYTKSIDDDGDLPYIDMFISPGTSYAHGFIDCVEQLMNYIDTYYEFFKPYTNPI